MNFVPLYILGALNLIGVGIVLEKHGKPRDGHHSIFLSLSSAIIQWSLILWAVYG